MNKRKISIIVTAVCAVLLLIYEIIGAKRIFGQIEDATILQLVDISVTRALGSIVFITLIAYFGYKILSPTKKPFLKSLLICLPAFLVAVNNFPFSAVISGGATVEPTAKIAILFIECLLVALFEETAFRGVILLGFAEKRRGSIKGLFVSIILSSAVFGAVHLLNLIDSSPIAVLMQIGYSFLIGAMCSVVLFRTSNIWLCVAVHAIFNFSGAIVPTFGNGEIWDTFTVILTAVIAVAVTVYMVFAFLKTDLKAVNGIYKK